MQIGSLHHVGYSFSLLEIENKPYFNSICSKSNNNIMMEGFFYY